MRRSWRAERRGAPQATQTQVTGNCRQFIHGGHSKFGELHDPKLLCGVVRPKGDMPFVQQDVFNAATGVVEDPIVADLSRILASS
jgi:hypothetical protein